MIVYFDSSVIARAYLANESGHEAALALVRNPAHTAITGSWTRIEVTGALVRSARATGRSADDLLAALDADFADAGGSIGVVDAVQAEIEHVALTLVRKYGLLSMDAWHLACANLAFEELAEPGEELGFATRDSEQAAVAREFGYTLVFEKELTP